AAGNVSPPTGAYPITVDTQAPARPVIESAEDNVGAVQGPISSGSRTDDTTPTLVGKGEAGSVVYVYDNGKLLGSATVNGQGNWSYTPTTPLGEGQHSFTVTSEDKAGNISATSDPYVVIVDDPVPTQTATVTSMGKDSGISSTDWLTNDGSAGRLMQGTLSAALAANQSLQVSTDGGRTWVNAQVDGLNWVAQDSLAHSNNWRIETRVVGSSGQFGNVTSQSVELDTEAPLAPTAIEWIHLGPNADDYLVVAKFKPDSMVVGDTFIFEVGGQVYSTMINAQQVSQGSAFIHVQASKTDFAKAAFVDRAGNVSDYIASKQSVIVTEDFTGRPNTPPYLKGSTLELDTMSVKVLQGQTFIGSYVASTPTYGEGQRLYFGYSGVYGGDRLEISAKAGSCETMNFTTDYLHNSATYSFYDTNGALLETLTFPGKPDGYKVSFTAPPGKLIGKMIAFTNEWGFLDNFEFVLSAGGFNPTGPQVEQTITANGHGVFYGGSEDNLFKLANVADLAKVQVEGNGGVDTLKLTGRGQNLDLTQLPGKVSSIEIFDITGVGNNTLSLSLADVLENGSKDLFVSDDRVQLMVKGNMGDEVNLSDLLGADGMDTGDWAAKGQMTSGGVTYNVYQHSGMDAELLVQQNVQVNLV
ncbi:TPA: hypothetical protein L4T35_000943, partial [Pseudomonas aeruginosa]|nr:hypothetical protein [Pseudomonas aeruginosa]